MGQLKICEKCGSGYNWAKGYDNYCYQCTEELKQSPPKLCIYCQFFILDPAHPGYSDATPGYSAEMNCQKGKWKYCPFDDSRVEFVNKLKTAETCPDFTPEVFD